jgi:hypothetical protein
LFHLYRAQPGLTDLQRAARFLMLNKNSFGSNGHSFGMASTSQCGFPCRRGPILAAIKALGARLDGVIIENLPYGDAWPTPTGRRRSSTWTRPTSAPMAVNTNPSPSRT